MFPLISDALSLEASTLALSSLISLQFRERGAMFQALLFPSTTIKIRGQSYKTFYTLGYCVKRAQNYNLATKKKRRSKNNLSSLVVKI